MESSVATDKRELKEQLRDQRTAEERAREVVTNLMNTPEGREWFNDLMEIAGTFHDGFNSDPFIHANNAGRRSIGQYVLAQVTEYCPNLYIKLLEERSDERTKSYRRERGLDGGTDDSVGDDA